MKTEPCHTHTYLTEKEEHVITNALLLELQKDSRYSQAVTQERLQQAPAEMCDLIF